MFRTASPGGEGLLARPDLTTLVNERLDLIGAIEVVGEGVPGALQLAHVLPPVPGGELWKVLDYRDTGQLDLDFDDFVLELESELERAYREHGVREEREGVVLVGFSRHSKEEAEERLEELEELCASAGKVMLASSVQFRRRPDPRYLVGKGKLEENILNARQVGADTLIFDAELAPSQVKAIAAQTDLNIMDRTQLILEIFASRAKSSEGKLQVQLAQLRYTLPRLVGKGVDLSQLGGGIGTRGPGEKKVEEQRRLLRKRIDHLEHQIDDISRRRELGRKRRKSSGIPTVTLIGYTSVGKSTLFNTITKSNVLAEKRLFSTLTPTTRRIVLPGGREVLLTDTVGFIRDLPAELIKAFRATLEELGESTLLVHIADASDQGIDERIDAVERILDENGLGDIPELLVLNKADLLREGEGTRLARMYNAPLISALEKKSVRGLLTALDQALGGRTASEPDDLHGAALPGIH